jgi:hypothetical protein
MEPVVKAKQANVLAAWNELTEAKASMDPKKMQAAQVKFDALNGEYHQSLGKFDEHLKQLTDQEGKEKLKQMEIDAKEPKEPNKTDYQLTKAALTEKLKRPPTESEIQNYMQTAKEEAARAGRLAFGDIRQITVLDTRDNNNMITMTATEFNEANKKEPGRYLDSAKAQKTLTQRALLEDIHGAIKNSQGSISRLKSNFDETTRLLLYKAVTSTNPTGAISNIINGQFGKAMSPDQIDYLTDLNQVVENAMAMRSVLGAGQGSDQLRDAIKATVPNAGTFSKEMALAQLKKFEMQVNRLERGVAGVKLASPKGEIENVGTQTGGTVKKV